MHKYRLWYTKNVFSSCSQLFDLNQNEIKSLVLKLIFCVYFISFKRVGFLWLATTKTFHFHLKMTKYRNEQRRFCIVRLQTKLKAIKIRPKKKKKKKQNRLVVHLIFRKNSFLGKMKDVGWNKDIETEMTASKLKSKKKKSHRVYQTQDKSWHYVHD